MSRESTTVNIVVCDVCRLKANEPVADWYFVAFNNGNAGYGMAADCCSVACLNKWVGAPVPYRGKRFR